jgi:dipeptidyl-peptidase-4
VNAHPAALAALLLALATAPVRAGAPPETPRPLTLERLYSLPWLIGTSPQAPAWAPDSRALAFLWNDDGGNFRDVWLADLAGGAPRRVTALPRPALPAAPGTDVALLEQVARAERDHGVSALAWAPDGRHLLFVFHRELYSVLPGTEPVRVAAPPGGVGGVVVAPHGPLVAFMSGGELWVVAPGAAHPEPRRLYAAGRADVGIESATWSADGTRLAFVEADEGRVPVRGIPDYLGAETRLVPTKRAFPGEPSAARRVGIVAADGGEPRWAVLGGDPQDEIFGVAWSPRGDELLVDTSDLYIKDRRLLRIDPATGRPRLLVEERDPHNVTAEWWADWAPDGRGVYFTSDRDNDYHVYYAGLDGTPPRAVTSGDFAVFSATVSATARALIVVTNAGRAEERQVFRVPLAGGAAERLTSAPGYHEPLPSPDGRLIADLHSSDTEPPELFVQPARAGAPAARVRALTHSPLPEFSDYRWVAARYVTFPNASDGTMLHARMTLPPDFDPARRYPAILGSVYSNTAHNRWGGRVFHPTWALDQYLAQHGYVLLNVDISGSSGYGKRFRQRIGEDYGGVDVDDLASAARYLGATGFVDPRRIGIWGSSYGGLLTTMSLFRYPGVFRAGVAGAPATSLFHAETGEMRTMMAPADHDAEYRRASPFLRSGGLADHLLIIHGMRDDTVLFKDSVTLAERLILQGKDVDFVMLPDAPHGWDTEGLAQTRFAFRKLVDYFDRYLGAGAH